jgi:hypothetical protein
MLWPVYLRATAMARHEGSVALSLCATVHPLDTLRANRIGTSVAETTMRSNPAQTPALPPRRRARRGLARIGHGGPARGFGGRGGEAG